MGKKLFYRNQKVTSFTQLHSDGYKTNQLSDNFVLRIPILYGDVEYLDESAITTLFKKLVVPDKVAEMSDYEIRRPSHVSDIASIVHDLISRCSNASGVSLDKRFH